MRSGRVDAVQQRHKVPAFVFGIIRKYGDDNGGVLVSSLAYSGFVSLFPLLLVLVTLLGLVPSGDPWLSGSGRRCRRSPRCGRADLRDLRRKGPLRAADPPGQSAPDSDHGTAASFGAAADDSGPALWPQCRGSSRNLTSTLFPTRRFTVSTGSLTASSGRTGLVIAWPKSRAVADEVLVGRGHGRRCVRDHPAL